MNLHGSEGAAPTPPVGAPAPNLAQGGPASTPTPTLSAPVAPVPQPAPTTPPTGTPFPSSPEAISPSGMPPLTEMEEGMQFLYGQPELPMVLRWIQENVWSQEQTLTGVQVNQRWNAMWEGLTHMTEMYPTFREDDLAPSDLEFFLQHVVSTTSASPLPGPVHNAIMTGYHNGLWSAYPELTRLLEMIF